MSVTTMSEPYDALIDDCLAAHAQHCEVARLANELPMPYREFQREWLTAEFARRAAATVRGTAAQHRETQQ